MNNFHKAITQFLEHASTASILESTDIGSGDLKFKNYLTVLELGPGDSLISAVIAKSLDAKKIWLVDAGNFAGYEVDNSSMSTALRAQNLSDPLFGVTNVSLSEYLQICNCEYLTQGLNSLISIPDGSIDYCFSNAVLEHVQKKDFYRTITELYRLLKPGGICVHRVDLRDHLGGALNNLRFTEATWESSLFASSGFYTNRIRFGEMLKFFEQAGFLVRVENKKNWEHLPTARISMDQSFSSLPVEDLRVQVFDLIAIK
ncbi:class I SAM-dependent methyltransferase [Polynucleobacter alcilacus]|uniref:class I SAM-dependent methyltransferase n=1 Tax=Polynucleobacter alcilacus TaxID=1819739 RepID=UPI001C0E55F7|nr:class I SAM-dependent methyltransferase [Polynucleobacter alcilacus]MBU3568198.1 methyltransferase domain-containing protein [Polynucleobacter alcilacus]